jgi:hypothetical protein
LGTETNTDGRPSRLQARTYQLEFGLQERIPVLLVDSDRSAQDDKQIGSRRRDLVKTDVDITQFVSGLDDRGFE